MGVLSPWMLLGLLSVPAIVVLYLLRLKRQPLRISSVTLWQRLIEDQQANAPFQKLRRNLLLFVQLLLALLLVAAATRPYRLVPGMTGKTTIVVLDISASMQATDVRPNRFEAARGVIRRIIDRLSAGDRLALVVAGNRARTACPLTGDKQALRAALAAVHCGDTSGNLKEGAAVAGALAAGRPATVLFVTDAASVRVEQVPLGALEPRLIRVGRRARNLGLTALAARTNPDPRKPPLLYCRLFNAGNTARTTTLEFYAGKRLLDAREVTVPARRDKALIIGDLPVRSGLLRAHLREKDDLAVDNDAYVYLGSGRALNVLLVSSGNLFLEQALTVDPQVSAARVAPGDFDPALTFDVAVLDNCAPPDLPPGNYLFIGKPAGPRSPLLPGASVKAPEITSVLAEHPVNQYVDWPHVQVARAHPGRLRPGSMALVETPAGMLVAAAERGARRSLALAFTLTDSDFPLRADFPVFIANALRWLTRGAPAATAVRVVPTGSVLTLGGKTTFTSPEGRTRPLSSPDGSPAFCPVRVGVYVTHTDGGATSTVAANLLDPQETDLKPGDSLRFAHREVKQRLAPSLAKSELTWWFIIAALVVMMGEWWLYHRRP